MTTYLTLDQVAERLHTPIATVRYWVSVGKLQAYKPGRHPLIRESDLEAFVESSAIGTVRSTRARQRRAS